MPDPILEAKVYINVLPVWNSTLQGREGSIPGYRCVKVFHANGNRPLLLREAGELYGQAAAGGEA